MKSNLNKTKGIIFLIFLLIPGFSFAQNKSGFEFIQQDISEIIYSVSLANTKPIVCDDTVVGKASFRFAGTDFESAFDSFLSSNRLYVTKNENVWTVSRIKIDSGNTSGNYNIDAYDVLPMRLFEKISEITGETIIHETLPSVTLSIHVKDVSISQAVKLIMKSWPEYEVKEENGYVQVQRVKSAAASILPSTNGRCDVRCQTVFNEQSNDYHNTYTLNVEKSTLGAILEQLCTLEGVDYSNLARPESPVERIISSDKSFEDTLRLICAQCNSAYTKKDGLYIIFNSQEEIQNLVQKETTWSSVNLKYIKADELMPLIQSRFTDVRLLKISDISILFESTPEKNSDIQNFIALCDLPKATHVVSLQYIKPSEFLSHLPPSVSASQFTDTGSGNTLFYTGSDESFEILKQNLKEIDKPSVRVRYDLLILQVQDSSSDKWNVSHSAGPSALTDATNLQAVLGSVLSLNFDVLGSFGYSFASQLQTAISDNTAEVFADTTLHGVSGTNIKFQNTNTYRYREPYVDSTTGETKNSGVTREIVSGLFLDIEGWVSGDGMVTTTVKATVSRQGADVSSSTGNPPPTYEKQITTQVRGLAGEPVILTGLKQTDMSKSEQRTPWISKIPIIGWLFKGKNDSKEKTEMIIYLVPHIDNETVTEEMTTSLLPDSLQQRISGDGE